MDYSELEMKANVEKSDIDLCLYEIAAREAEAEALKSSLVAAGYPDFSEAYIERLLNSRAVPNDIKVKLTELKAKMAAIATEESKIEGFKNKIRDYLKLFLKDSYEKMAEIDNLIGMLDKYLVEKEKRLDALTEEKNRNWADVDKQDAILKEIEYLDNPLYRNKLDEYRAQRNLLEDGLNRAKGNDVIATDNEEIITTADTKESKDKEQREIDKQERFIELNVRLVMHKDLTLDEKKEFMLMLNEVANDDDLAEKCGFMPKNSKAKRRHERRCAQIFKELGKDIPGISRNIVKGIDDLKEVDGSMAATYDSHARNVKVDVRTVEPKECLDYKGIKRIGEGGYLQEERKGRIALTIYKDVYKNPATKEMFQEGYEKVKESLKYMELFVAATKSVAQRRRKIDGIDNTKTTLGVKEKNLGDFLTGLVSGKSEPPPDVTVVPPEVNREKEDPHR